MTKMNKLIEDANLIISIDCTHNTEDYWESHQTKINHTQCGSYRETPEIKFSRFAYRFKIPNIQKPHVLRVKYPDDRRRTFCIMDGRTYDISTGIATGREFPLSMKMQTHDILFWPRCTDLTVMFISWEASGPAAVSTLEIFQLQEDSLDNVTPIVNAVNTRKIGFQWEDPCGRYCTLGAVRKPDWSKRLASYMAMMKQSILCYPISWYWGILYPSQIDTPDFFELICDGKANTFAKCIEQPYDWLKELLTDLADKGIDFMGVFHTCRFRKLCDSIDYPENKNLIKNMSYEGKIQQSTYDWTRTWTTKNLELMGKYATAETTGDLEGTAYHCISGMKFYPEQVLGEPMGVIDGDCGPIFNLLHPDVEKHLLDLMDDMNQKYCCFSNFKGITIPLWANSFIWWASLKLGYDDLSFTRFEQENNLCSNINPLDPQKYLRRYEWLMTEQKELWIRWRCIKVRELLSKMHAKLSKGRNDIKLVISICREPMLGQLYSGSYQDPDIQLYNMKDFDQILQEGGIDINKYNDCAGIEFELQMDPYRDRSLEHKSGEIPESNTLRDHDFLDRTINSLASQEANRNVFIFNCYYESGNYCFENTEYDKAALDNNGSGSGDHYQMHLIHKHNIWPWFDHEFTTCPGIPGTKRNFLEYYAHAIAHFDAKQITFGGLAPGSIGHEEQIGEFTSVFSALPQEAFVQIKDDSDSVVIRDLRRDDDYFFYAVNTEPFPMNVSAQFNTDSFIISELNTDFAYVQENKNFCIELRPFELKAFKISTKNVKISSYEVDTNIIIKRRVEISENILHQAKQLGSNEKWQEQLIDELEYCLSNNRLGRLRHVLNSYLVRKWENAPKSNRTII